VKITLNDGGRARVAIQNELPESGGKGMARRMGPHHGDGNGEEDPIERKLRLGHLLSADEMDRAAALIQAAAPSAPGGANAAELIPSAPGGANAADLDKAAALIQSAAPAAARGASAAELDKAAALIQGAAPAASAGEEDPTERKLRLGHLLSADEVEEQKRRAAREEEAEKADGTS